MKITKKIRLQLRLQSSLFFLLLIAFAGVLAWLSTQYTFSFDLTANQRNSLSEPTLRLLGKMQKPLKITAFVTPVNEVKESLDTLFKRYQQQQPLIEYQSLNPDLVPDQLRTLNIRRDGEVVIQFGERSENITQVNESNVTNAMARLLRAGDRWIVFVQGHGERDPFGEANHHYQLLGAQLSQKGFNVETVHLTDTTSIPENTDVLVIADASTDFLEGERKLIERYAEEGGNLVWLNEPGSHTLDVLADKLELSFLPGVIVDPSTQLLGLKRVDFALVADYPRHAITTAIDSLSLYPTAQAIDFSGEQTDWQATPLMVTHERTWNETGELKGDITFGDNDDEQTGPLTIGMALTRSLQNEDGKLLTQRIIVAGDADFLSNQYLGNGSNLALGLNLFNWLSHDDDLIAISPRRAIDTHLELSDTQQIIIAALFLVLMPVLLLGSGIRIWLVRRKR